MERRGFRIVQRAEGTRGDLAALTADAERLYWRLMLACDEHGCHRAEPAAIAGDALVGVKITLKQTEKAITELLLARVIDVWDTEQGERWCEIRNFDAGQTPKFIEKRYARIAPPNPQIEPEEAPAEDKKDDPRTTEQVKAVFDHWLAGEQRTGGAERALLTDGRRTVIRARLDDGYTVDDLCKCIDGFHADPFHLGQNNRQSRYTDITTLLKNARKVDAGMQKAKQQRGDGPRDRFSEYD